MMDSATTMSMRKSERPILIGSARLEILAVDVPACLSKVHLIDLERFKGW